MLRDDIRDKVIELLHGDFQWINKVVLKENTILLIDLDIDSLDIVEFSQTLEFEFDINFISPDDISKWITVKDIVDYIEQNLEKEMPYISGFEPEA
jgi:acyl carrier protein